MHSKYPPPNIVSTVQTEKKPLFLYVLLLAFWGACTVTNGQEGCQAGRGWPIEVALAGPLIESPAYGQLPSPDRVTEHSTEIFFSWTHPRLEPGDTIGLEISAVEVAGLSTESTIGSVEGVLSRHQVNTGVFQVPAPRGGFLPGEYQATVYRNHVGFSWVDFRVDETSE
jgi:hypothetical protein